MTQRRPSRVTEILRDAGLVDTTWFTNPALAERGTAVHAAAHYLDEDRLDWSTVDPLVLPRLTQYQRFKDDMGDRYVILAVEEEVANFVLGYVGHVDRRALVNGREGVLDLKSPTQAPWQAIQTSLYSACYPRPMARWSLHLHDERYQLVEHRGARDWEVAKAAITIANWRRRSQS